MELLDLSHEERLALVGLLKWVAAADGLVTPSERAVMDATRAVFGDDTWRGLLRESQLVFREPSHLREFCTRQVTNPVARQLIFRHMARMASADGWDAAEVRLLNDVGVDWGLVDPADIVGTDEEFDLDDYDEDSDDDDTE